VEDFTAVLRLSADARQRANAHFNRGGAWDRLGQFQRSLADFQRARERAPPSGAGAPQRPAPAGPARAAAPAHAGGGARALYAPLAAGLCNH